MSASETQRIVDDNGFPHRRFYAEVPNLLDDSDLDPFAFRLYCHYKRVAGSGGGTFEESVRASEQHCRMSHGAVIKARAALVAGGWITIETPEERGRGKPGSRITLIDRWQESLDRYYPGSGHVATTSGGSGHTVNTSKAGSGHVVTTSLQSIGEELKEHTLRAHARALFGYFKEKIQPGSKVEPTEAILRRLKTFSEEDIRLAIDHFAADRWSMEHNGTRGASWFFQNATRIENWMNMDPAKRNRELDTPPRNGRVDYGDRNAPHEDPGADPHVNFTLRNDPEYVKRWNREHPDRAWDASKEKLRG